MELRELRTFCMVVDTGSFSSAAKAVCLTQPTVSLQVQALESDLGVCLFNRATREITLTEKGRLFYNDAKKIVAMCDEVARSVSDPANITKAILRIGAGTVVGEYILLPYLNSFKKIYPCTQIQLKIGDSMEIIKDVIKGGVEIGVVGVREKNEEIVCEKFINEKLVLIVSPEHPLASKDKITTEEFKGEPFLCRGNSSGIRIAIEEELEKAGIRREDLNVIMELGNSEAIKKGVMCGIGLSIIPEIAVENELKLGLLKKIEIEGMDLSMDFYIVYNENKFRSKMPELFVEHLLE